MQSLDYCMSQLLKSLGSDSSKLAQIALNNTKYRKAVLSIWKDENASRLILDETNAFYVRADEKPHKGHKSDQPYIVAEICIGDAIVRSEIDTHKEILAFALRSNGLTFEELRIIPARREMKNRHPFRDKD